MQFFHRLCTTLILCCSFGLGIIFFVLHNTSVDFSALEQYSPGVPSLVFDDQGNEWARFQLDRREPITLQKMPSSLINAFVAAEDWDFFQHAGISWKGIIRSLLVNFYYGHIVQGASTITQQLVKLLFFDSQKTFRRKIKEQIFSLLVERRFTKEQILQTYLNHVYFGCGIYGVQAASQRFWGKDVSDLTLDEVAVLAGIVRSPGNYCPIMYPLSAQKRRDTVLRKMMRMKFISFDEYEQLVGSAVVVDDRENTAMAPHLRESMRLFLEERFGKQLLYCGGLTIQTTLNRYTQECAERCFVQQCTKLYDVLSLPVDGALISMDVKTGGIKALVGGADFNKSKFNRALQSKRQMGSIFKPIVYAAALDSGMNFAQTEIDEPLHYDDGTGNVWSPNNYNRLFAGQMTLAYALSNSNNIVTIKTFLKTGAEKVIDVAKRFHIEGPLYPYPSLALGCVDATVKEAVGMFNVFANNGRYVEPHYINWVKDRWGTKLLKNRPLHEQIISECISGKVAKVLGLGLERVRKIFPREWIDCQAISKTGTTNDSRICWFIGSTPELTTAVYIACDDNRPLGNNVYPLKTAFPIWKELNRMLRTVQKSFSYDPSLREIHIHEKTGEQVPATDSKGTITILV